MSLHNEFFYLNCLEAFRFLDLIDQENNGEINCFNLNGLQLQFSTTVFRKWYSNTNKLISCFTLWKYIWLFSKYSQQQNGVWTWVKINSHVGYEVSLHLVYHCSSLMCRNSWRTAMRLCADRTNCSNLYCFLLDFFFFPHDITFDSKGAYLITGFRLYLQKCNGGLQQWTYWHGLHPSLHPNDSNAKQRTLYHL